MADAEQIEVELDESSRNLRGFDFNEEQLEALEYVREFMLDPEAIYCGLFGWAGTGKTSIIQQIVYENPTLAFAMSAPTHKAVAVLEEMGRTYGIRASNRTVHSLLRLRPVKRGGESFYEPDRRQEPPITFVDVVVLDECSMIDDDLYKLILDETHGDLFRRKKVIYMGDPLQLPPVSGTGAESKTFSVDRQTRLTKVMRHGGVIGDSVDRIRDNIQSKVVMRPKAGRDEMGEVRIYDAKRPWYDDFLELWEAGEDVKLLAYTNAAVDQATAHFREKLYGWDAAPFIQGERVVATEAYAPPVNDSDRYDSQNADILMRTEEPGTIIEAREAVHRDLACWRIKMHLPESGVTQTVYALDRSQKRAWNTELNRLAAEKNWKRFWPLKESFIWLRPSFATTIHKSQGSTYRYTFLDLANVVKATKPGEEFYRNRLLYVGASRASHGLMVFDNS